MPSWEFRVLFSGVIKPRPDPLRQTNIAIQLVHTEVEQKYVENYLAQFEFMVVWSEVTSFLQELWSELEE
jgi:hypothetical protein